MAGEKKKSPGFGRALPRRLVALLVLLLVGVGAYLVGSPSGAPLDYTDPALVVGGEKLFAKYCAVCHGRKAIGENPDKLNGGRKPEGGYWAPALNGTAHAWHHSPDGLFKVIKDGSPAKDSNMGGWKERMSDREIHSVIAYVQSLWPESLRQRYNEAFSSK